MEICRRNGCDNEKDGELAYCGACMEFVGEYNQGKFKSSVPFELANLRGMSWIYFVGSQDHEYIKIGRAQDVETRLSGIMVGSPFELHILARVFGFDQIEKVLHERFKEHHKRGEWFKSNPDLLKLISDLKDGKVPEYIYIFPNYENDASN